MWDLPLVLPGADQVSASLGSSHLAGWGALLLAVLVAAVFCCGYWTGCSCGWCLRALFARASPRKSELPVSPGKRRQAQAASGQKVSPLREGFAIGPRARSHHGTQ